MVSEYEEIEQIRERRIETGDFLRLHYIDAVTYACNLVNKPTQLSEDYKLITCFVYARKTDRADIFRDFLSEISEQMRTHKMNGFEIESADDDFAINASEEVLDYVWMSAPHKHALTRSMYDSAISTGERLRNNVGNNLDILVSIGRHPYAAWIGLKSERDDWFRKDSFLEVVEE